jgi:two-component system, cell cycle response regulator DivK
VSGARNARAATPILIVDDSPVNLKLVKVLLVNEGYDVRTAVDAEDALAVLAEFRPALILMDIQLPGMDGLTLTRRLKADPAHADVIIIALTAYAMKGDEERALDAGCDGYVTKPIDTRSLADVIATHLNRRRSEGRGSDG